VTTLQAWAGFLHVRPDAETTSALGENARGGYGTVLALASNAEEYRAAVEREMLSLGLAIIECENITPLVQAEDRDELAQLTASLNEHYPVQYRTFDTYTQDDA
jgi:hypothetical protein